MHRIFLANKPQRVLEHSVAKTGEAQDTFSEARKDTAQNAQADLDEAIERMVSEGGPAY
jgi:hypothetical protein